MTLKNGQDFSKLLIGSEKDHPSLGKITDLELGTHE